MGSFIFNLAFRFGLLEFIALFFFFPLIIYKFGMCLLRNFRACQFLLDLIPPLSLQSSPHVQENGNQENFRVCLVRLPSKFQGFARQKTKNQSSKLELD